ncbi:MAG: NAD(P)-dependent oxidoreductase, partial [Planctomycetota bacterium]
MNTSVPLSQISVLLLEGVHELAERALLDAGYTVECVPKSLSEDELIERADGLHMIGIRSKTHLTERFFEHAAKLWAVGCFCIGTNQVELEAAANRGVAVFNAPFSNTRSVAEKVIAEVISLHRRLFDRSSQMHAGRWVKSAAGSREVRGKTLGIIGYGRIGSQVSVLAEALGMRVIFYDTGTVLPMGNATQADTMEDVLRNSDAVTLHVPDLESTRGLIGERELGLCKPGVYLINNSRG